MFTLAWFLFEETLFLSAFSQKNISVAWHCCPQRPVIPGSPQQDAAAWHQGMPCMGPGGEEAPHCLTPSWGQASHMPKPSFLIFPIFHPKAQRDVWCCVPASEKQEVWVRAAPRLTTEPLQNAEISSEVNKKHLQICFCKELHR